MLDTQRRTLIFVTGQTWYSLIIIDNYNPTTVINYHGA